MYIPRSAVHPSLRIRRQGDAHEITKKRPVHGNDASHQREITIPISAEEFADFTKLKGRRVEKRRYYYKEKGVEYEIDVFRGDLKGLVLVDVEFKSRKEQKAFTAPGWLLADVTHEGFLAGGMVCGKKYKDLAKRLGALGYIPMNSGLRNSLGI